MTENRHEQALRGMFGEAGIREGEVGTCLCGAEARYWIDDAEAPRPVCLQHAEAHALEWQKARIESLLSNESDKRKLTNSELLERRDLSLEAVHPLEGWGRCDCGAEASYRVLKGPTSPWAHTQSGSGRANLYQLSRDSTWACQEHAHTLAARWGLLFEKWSWEPVVARLVLGPVVNHPPGTPPVSFAASKIRVVRCSYQGAAERYLPTEEFLRRRLGRPEVKSLECAGCATPIEAPERSQCDDLKAPAGPVEKVIFMCPACEETVAIVSQFLRWKDYKEAHRWVLHILKESSDVRCRWRDIRDLLDSWESPPQ